MATAFPVIVHEYPIGKDDKVSHAYELDFPQENNNSSGSSGSSNSKKNALVFIGGLFDGPHTVPYVRTTAKKLATAAPELGYSVFEARLRSSFTGWGVGSLARDVEDIAALVRYLRSIGKEKIVLHGHSTGCQDCLEYTNFEKYPDIPAADGFILQGPVSDREGLRPWMGEDEFDESAANAAKMVKEGRGKEFVSTAKLPHKLPLTAYRWHSLTVPGGDDDYFSSDLPDETVSAIWSRVKQPLLIVPSGEDEYVPKTVDVEKLVARWKSFCKPGIVSEFSGLIPGANHRADRPESQEWLADRVVKFLGGLYSSKL